MAASFGFHPDIVAFAAWIFLILDELVAVRFPFVGPAKVRLRLAKLRMEIQCVRRKRFGISPVVEIEIERKNFALSFISQRDAGVLLKGHGKKRVQGAIVRDGKKLGFPDVIVTKAQPEEIAQGSLGTREAFAIPVHAQNQFLQMIRLRIVECEPDVREHAWAVHVENGERRPGLDGAKIGVAARGVSARNSLEHIGLWLREVCLPVPKILCLRDALSRNESQQKWEAR